MSDWRPFEPSRDNVKRAEALERENTCNRHSDCAAANERVRNDPRNRDYYGRPVRMWADHCSADDCEECFGQ